MTDSAAGLLVVFGFLAAAVRSVPLALGAFLLARRVRPFSRALGYAGAGVGLLVVGMAAVVATVSPAASLAVAVLAAVLALLLWVLPLVVAHRTLVRRGVSSDRALRDDGRPPRGAVRLAGRRVR